jgi:hypothetical protein
LRESTFNGAADGLLRIVAWYDDTYQHVGCKGLATVASTCELREYFEESWHNRHE